jgi:hypothetical protein
MTYYGFRLRVYLSVCSKIFALHRPTPSCLQAKRPNIDSSSGSLLCGASAYGPNPSLSAGSVATPRGGIYTLIVKQLATESATDRELKHLLERFAGMGGTTMRDTTEFRSRMEDPEPGTLHRI